MKTLINIKTLIQTTLLSLLMVGCSWGAIKQRELGMMDAGGSTTPAQAEEQWEDFIALLDNANNWYEITDFLDQNKDFVNSKHKWEKDTGYTALHYAAQEADLDVVKELIAREADVNAKTGKGITPLHLAARKGHKDLVEYLVKEAEAEDLPDNLQGGRALHYAAGAGKLEVVKSLSEALKERGGETNPRDKNGFIPLHITVTKGDVALTKFFVNKTPDAIGEPGYDGNTSLHLAAYLGYTRILDILLSSPAIDIAILTKPNKGGMTPLQVAREEKIKGKLVSYLAKA